jgi:hypothetical protein
LGKPKTEFIENRSVSVSVSVSRRALLKGFHYFSF